MVIRLVMLGFSLILIGLDQFFKKLAIEHLTGIPGGTIPIIEDVLHFTYVENRGAAFGIMQNMRAVMISITIIAILSLLIYIFAKKVENKLLLLMVGLIVGGGIGNLIDRISLGFVVDYIDFRLINFAVFNFADCCVVIGTILLVIYILFIEGKSSKKTFADADLASKLENPERKLSLTIEDHTENKTGKLNKYITVVGQIGNDDPDNGVISDDANNITAQDGGSDGDE